MQMNIRKVNSMKQNHICILILALLCSYLITGCVQIIPPESSSEETSTLPSSVMSTPSMTQTTQATITPTRTFPLVTLSAIPSPTASMVTPNTSSISPENIGLKQQCLNIAPELPAHLDIEDIIVLTPAYPNNLTQIYLWNMETDKKQSLLLEGEGFLNTRGSPDGQWLAYLGDSAARGENLWIIIFSPEGEEIAAYPYIEGADNATVWLDNQHLVVSKLLTPDNYYGPHVPLLFLNPFTGERQEVPPLPAHLADMIPPPDATMFAYDPSLTYFVYPDVDFTTVLENLQTKEILARFETVWESVPRWSPDGKRFLIQTYFWEGGKPSNGGLYSIDLQGEMQLLLSGEDADFERTSYYWSPDGRYIALWLITDADHDNRVTLGVLDTKTLDVISYCIETEHTSKFPPPIFWSPNSKQLVMEVDEISGRAPRTVVVDIIEGWATEIADDMIPAGWMLAP